MPRSRNEPETLKTKRRRLASQEKELALRMSRLTQELRDGPRAAKNPVAAHPVWRLEDEITPRQASESVSLRSRRDLARQRRRDKIIFFVFVAVLALVSMVFFLLYHAHMRPE